MRKLTASVIAGLAIVAALIGWSAAENATAAPVQLDAVTVEAAQPYPPEHLVLHDDWSTATVAQADTYPHYGGAATVHPTPLVQPVAKHTITSDDALPLEGELTLAEAPEWAK